MACAEFMFLAAARERLFRKSNTTVSLELWISGVLMQENVLVDSLRVLCKAITNSASFHYSDRALVIMMGSADSGG
jgi:hypothetical protein